MLNPSLHGPHPLIRPAAFPETTNSAGSRSSPCAMRFPARFSLAGISGLLSSPLVAGPPGAVGRGRSRAVTGSWRCDPADFAEVFAAPRTPARGRCNTPLSQCPCRSESPGCYSGVGKQALWEGENDEQGESDRGGPEGTGQGLLARPCRAQCERRAEQHRERPGRRQRRPARGLWHLPGQDAQGAPGPQPPDRGPIEIPESRTVGFKVGQSLKDKL
jgi:hypothetical protein